VLRILLAGLVALAQGAGAGELVLRVSEGWGATRIVSDAPQSAILEFGDQYALPSGELVFWGRIRDGKDGWALFSLQGDRLRTILTEGESSASRYGEPGAKLHLHYRSSSLLHRATRIFAGKVLVISTERKITTGGSVYSWDGERLRGVLVEGERTTLGGAGVIAGGFAWAASPDGEVLLGLRTEKPNPYAAWALFDGRSPRLVVRSGEPLPGLPDTRVAEFWTGGSGSNCRVWLFDGGQIVTDLNFSQGGADMQAIVLLSPGGSERLLGRGDPLLGDPAKTIDLASVVTAESPRSFVARLFPLDPASKRGLREVTYASCDGSGCRPPSQEEVNAFEGNGHPVPWQSASSLRWSGDWRQERSGDKIINHGRRDLEAVRGGEITQLTPPGLLLDDTATIRLVDGEFLGAIVEGSYWDAASAKDGYVDIGKVKPKQGSWFVAADDLAAGLQPNPTLRTLDGRSASLADVLIRKGTGQVIAQFGKGLYRLEKAAVPPSP
jgi:hypothetical protein